MKHLGKSVAMLRNSDRNGPLLSLMVFILYFRGTFLKTGLKAGVLNLFFCQLSSQRDNLCAASVALWVDIEMCWVDYES